MALSDTIMIPSNIYRLHGFKVVLIIDNISEVGNIFQFGPQKFLNVDLILQSFENLKMILSVNYL